MNRLGMTIFLLLVSNPLLAWEPFAFDRGNYRYLNNDFEGARTLYEGLVKSGNDSARLHYNQGDTYYRLGRFEEARKEYEKSLESTDAGLRENALYNLGNTFYREQKLEESVAAYDKVIAAHSDNEKARLNRDFVLKKLQEKKQKEDEEKKNDEKKNEEKQNEEKKNEEKQQDPPADQKEQQEQEEKKDQKDQKEDAPGEEKPPQPFTLSPKQAEQLLQSVEDDPRSALQERFLHETSVPPKNNPRDW